MFWGSKIDQKLTQNPFKIGQKSYLKEHIPKETFGDRKKRSQNRPTPSDPGEGEALGGQNWSKIDQKSIKIWLKIEKETDQT